MNYDIVESIDRSTGSYEYDELRVVRSRETGILYYATDSGCSCPQPFEAEDADFPAAWTPIKRGDSWKAFVAFVHSWSSGSEGIQAKEQSDFIDKIRRSMKRTTTPTEDKAS